MSALRIVAKLFIVLMNLLCPPAAMYLSSSQNGILLWANGILWLLSHIVFWCFFAGPGVIIYIVSVIFGVVYTLMTTSR